MKEPRLEEFQDESRAPSYAILSHTWREQEVTHLDLAIPREAAKRNGWSKLQAFREKALENGYRYVWIDTCCIDKTSSAELAEALNSMYRWYKNSDVCYAYLDDVDNVGDSLRTESETMSQLQRRLSKTPKNIPGTDSAEMMVPKGKAERLFALSEESTLPEVSPKTSWTTFQSARWFNRGWTLQEMVAPRKLLFFEKSWNFIGTLHEHANGVARITGVDADVLRGDRPVSSYSLAQRMCWAANRQTTRLEDRAYSLLGLFDISLTVIYGEGNRAFQRLQEELLRVHMDASLFAWHSPRTGTCSAESKLFAASPSDFKDSGSFVPMPREALFCPSVALGDAIRFELPVLDSPATGDKKNGSDALREAAICWVEDDRCKVVTLVLKKVAVTEDSYAIHSEGLRIRTGDMYDFSRRCSRQAFNVLRSDLSFSSHQSRSSTTTIVCRYKARHKRKGILRIAPLWPDSNWNPRSQSFVLPNHSLAVFSEEMSVQSDSSRRATLWLNRSANGKLTASFYSKLDRTWFSNNITALAPVPMTWIGGRIVIARAGRQHFLHGSLDILELETLEFWEGSIFLARYAWALQLSFAAWTLRQAAWFLPAPLTLVVPFFTFVLRRKSSDRYKSLRLLDPHEIAILAAGVPIACAVSLAYRAKHGQVLKNIRSNQQARESLQRRPLHMSSRSALRGNGLSVFASSLDFSAIILCLLYNLWPGNYQINNLNDSDYSFDLYGGFSSRRPDTILVGSAFRMYNSY